MAALASSQYRKPGGKLGSLPASTLIPGQTGSVDTGCYFSRCLHKGLTGSWSTEKALYLPWAGLPGGTTATTGQC